MKIYAYLKRSIFYVIRIAAHMYSWFPWIHTSYLYYYKKEHISSHEKTVCFVFDSTWNTIETWLPVLCWLKEHNNYKIISFWPQGNQDIWKKGHETLFEMMIFVSNIVVLNRWTVTYWRNKKRLFFVDAIREEFLSALHMATYRATCKRIFGHYKILAFLRLLDDNSKYWGVFYELFPHSPHITHPHTGFFGMFVFSKQGEWSYYNRYMSYNKGLTINTSTDSCLWENLSNEFKRQMVVVGTPRYDDWWISRLLGLDSEFLTMKKRISSQKDKIVTVCMPNFSYDENRDDLILEELNELKCFFESNICRNLFFLFKFHPAVPQLTIDRFFQECFPENSHNYYVSSLPLIYLAKLSDVVISTGITTVTMDAVIMCCPTIEFYFQRQFIGDLSFYVCDDGTLGTFLKLHRLALYASNALELEAGVVKIFEGEISWDDYYKRLQQWVRLDGRACERMADLVEQYNS